MLIWIPLTIMAALFQSFRNASQKQLKDYCSLSGTTLARFLPALPMSLLYLLVLYQYYPEESMPTVSVSLLLSILCAATMQIIATILMVKLFQLRNYAIGVGFTKSEAIIAAVLGVLFFSDSLSVTAWIGVFIGSVAVWLMNVSGLKKLNSTKRGFSPILIGLASGLCFALCSLYIRESSMIIQKTSGIKPLVCAAWTLSFVLLTQTILLSGYLLMREPKTFKVMYQNKRLTIQVGLFSLLASIGWFSAMSLQTVGMVKTLGQIEIVFTLLISAALFKEKLQRYDYVGLLLIVIGATFVILG